MANSFGKLLTISTFGESHGPGVGVVIDGCPPGYPIDPTAVQVWLQRRRPGQSALTSPRNERDEVEILSGFQGHVTLGTPITLLVRNLDQKPGDYQELKDVLRPSHGDYTTLAKYGIKADSGGGRLSARETIGRVAAAASLEQILEQRLPGFRTVAYVDEVKGVRRSPKDPMQVTRIDTEHPSNPLRAAHPDLGKDLTSVIEEARHKGDSVGGVISCMIHGVPPGLGEPVFDKLEADLAKAMLSLPASKGFEVGSGFAGTTLFGSEHNDAFYTDTSGAIRTRTNHSGGIQGGISNGEAITMRVAFKPVATIFQEQTTTTRSGAEVTYTPKTGRHDPCVLPRAVPMVEAMAILVIADHWLRQGAITASR